MKKLYFSLFLSSNRLSTLKVIERSSQEHFLIIIFKHSIIENKNKSQWTLELLRLHLLSPYNQFNVKKLKAISWFSSQLHLKLPYKDFFFSYQDSDTLVLTRYLPIFLILLVLLTPFSPMLILLYRNST